MKVGPTVRICLLSVSGGDAAAPVDASGGGAEAAVPCEGAPFLAAAGVAFGSGRDIFFALSSVTMMSPCCSAAALSSIDFRASAQVWPAALQEQDGLNSV